MSDGHRQRPCLPGLRLALRSVDPPPRTRIRSQGRALLCLPMAVVRATHEARRRLFRTSGASRRCGCGRQRPEELP
ncbi:hypothetical protein CBM2629_B10291 [Cupriavidus taiwanensis]|nr:hypothetical protein CBM2629_B10291 [Cupriavidus taiwanensis]